MNLEIGTEATQFSERNTKMGVSLQCTHSSSVSYSFFALCGRQTLAHSSRWGGPCSYCDEGTINVTLFPFNFQHKRHSQLAFSLMHIQYMKALLCDSDFAYYSSVKQKLGLHDSKRNQPNLNAKSQISTLERI